MSVKKKYSTKHGRDVWGYDARIGKRRLRKFGFSTEEAAQLALSKARVNAYDRKQGVAPPERPAAVTVRALVERRSLQLQATPRRRTSARLLERWLATLPAGLLVTDLTTALLQEFVSARLAEVKEQTVFRELTDICSMLNNARDLFSSLEGWTPPRRPRMRTPTMSRDRLISKEEAAAVLARLRSPRAEGETERYWRVRRDAADLLQIALLTSARRSEILSLRRTDVLFEMKTLRVVDRKTSKVKNIPMTEALAALLRRRVESAGRSPLLFPALEGSTMLRANTDQIFRAACRPLGIPYGRDVAGGWVLHDARHTAITAMLHAGNSLESVMAISGHSARVMAMRYAHSTEATRRAAVAALEQFADEKESAFVSTPARETRQTRQTGGGVTVKKGGKSKGKAKKAGKMRAARV